MSGEDDQLPWTGLLSPHQLEQLKDAVPSFLICPAYTGRFGAADETGLVKIMGSSTDLYHAKKILSRWHEKTTQPSDKVRWWTSFVEEKGVQPVMSHDILDGLDHPRWTAYVATYNKAVAAQHQRGYHARKKAAAIQAKQRDHRVARQLVGLSTQPGKKADDEGKEAGPSGAGEGRTAA